MLSERPSLLFQFILLLKSVQISLIPSLHSLKQILTRNKKHSSKLWRCLEKNQFSNLSPSEREHNGQLYKAATKNDSNYRIQKTIKFMNKINKSSDSKNNLKFLLLIRSIYQLVEPDICQTYVDAMFLLCAYGWNLEKKIFLKAFTTNTCPQRVFSLVQTCSLVDDNQLLPWFSRVGQERILSPFLEHLEEHVGIQAVFAKFWWYFFNCFTLFFYEHCTFRTDNSRD